MAGTCGEEELVWLLRGLEEGVLKIPHRSLRLLCVATVGTAFLLSIECNLCLVEKSRLPFSVCNA